MADATEHSSKSEKREASHDERPAGRLIPYGKAASHAAVEALAKTDATILRLQKLLSTSAGQEVVLSTLNYSSQVLHYLLESYPLAALRARIRSLLLQKLGGKAPAAPPPPPSSARPPLLAFSSLMSETRYTLRLFQLISIWSWGSSVYKSPPKDRTLRAIAYLEVLLILVYQALENVVYLASKGIAGQKLVSRIGGAKNWSLWSCRAWFGYVLLQFVRLRRESVLFAQQEREKMKLRAEQVLAGEKPASPSDQEEAEARRLVVRTWRKKLVNSLAWAPLCAHWSFEQGIGVPANLTGLISLSAGVWNTYDTWQATA
ncbi:hypothetical protein BGW36DRAFT_367282 [Talaromyces proteolyticus]|uniref:Peroxin 11C n=1 Tax=Talaromyces proteolyticus TaxID=1131652 RepID=A0AAD4L574_9EURO|nr:uncharacterized protein BGW36DRAFT_367282 [Talaromyces proteolyticus]KAH8705286.1 hypothetical protein BGW36DRAFT_367282 [Talaromyces proteolyticus]